MMQKKPTAAAITDGRPTTTTPTGQQLQARNLDKDKSLQICPRCRHKWTLELQYQRCSYQDIKLSSGLGETLVRGEEEQLLGTIRFNPRLQLKQWLCQLTHLG